MCKARTVLNLLGIMELSLKFQKLCQNETRKYVIIVGIVAITYLMLQYFMLPYGNALKSLVSDQKVILSINTGYLSVRSETEGGNNHLSNVGVVRQDDQSNITDGFIESGNGLSEADRILQNNVGSEGTGRDEPGGIEKFPGVESGVVIQDNQSKIESNDDGKSEEIVGPEHQISVDRSLDSNESSNIIRNENAENWDEENLVQMDYVEDWNHEKSEDGRKIPERKSGSRRKKKVRPGMPPITVIPIDRMNQILAKYIASSSKMKPQWWSLRDRDKEILDAKFQIINSAVSHVDKELYAPVFRNVSTFMRSYELMEKTLKVYVYKDGTKPIFHQPIPKGLYASEGWFMKLMEGNKRFLVKKPDRAHLFYMPFSSRMLEYALYVPTQNRTKLWQFVKGYTEAIAAKYPFWNRTGGADHFVVACQDWPTCKPSMDVLPGSWI